MRRALLSALGIGFVPGIPGTYASAATAAACLGATHAGAPMWVAAAVAVVLGCAATLLAYEAGPAAGGKHGDPSWVVTDEVAGQGLALLGVAGASATLLPAAVSFVAFRALDILKPGAIGALERLPGAVGVLADDLLAGVVAGAITYGVVALAGL